MAAAYLSTGDVDAVITAISRQSLFSEDGTVAGYVSADFTSANEKASAIVQSAAQNAGYTLSDTTTDNLVKAATLGQFLQLAYGRKGIPVPAQWAGLVAMKDEIMDGRLPLVADPDVRPAVGGYAWSDQSTTSADGRPQIFSRKSLFGY